ncbi:hypothetical protein O181_037695 [Austropuccinia psidii MF-1]|uniref:Uncharacterized protein n=1 Tax=Austropuccinia psidii MF-1 TaxID=1389203 RepID=A0A9Q3HDE1_9BASI|nr:hypothetical protein [Austropuccinia psidii MF-1]
MASSGHFDPAQTYDGYKEVEKPCRHTGLLASNVRRYSWSKKDGPFGKEFQVSEGSTPDGISGYSNLTGSRHRNVARWTNAGGPIPVGGEKIYSSSEFPISRINTAGVVKQIRHIADSPPDPDAEGSDELDGEEVEVVHNYSGQKYSNEPSHPPSKRSQSQIIPRNPRYFQPILSTIPDTLPPDSPNSSTTRPALVPAVRPLPIVTSQQLKTVASSSRREELSPFPFPAAQVFQKKDLWPIQATREDPNTSSEN